MAKILVVEDELIIAREIKKTLSTLGYEPVEEFIDTSEGTLNYLEEHAVDLILMDINISGETDGIATAILINENHAIPVIFLTAFSDDNTISRAKLAIPYGYIIKPYNKTDLKANIEIALHKAKLTDKTPPPIATEIAEVDLEQPKAFFVKKANKHVKVAVVDILFIKAFDNYLCLYTEKDEYVVYGTLKDIEQRLPKQFFKSHRSFLVNLDRIDSFEESYILIGKKAIPVSRANKEELKKRIAFL